MNVLFVGTSVLQSRKVRAEDIGPKPTVGDVQDVRRPFSIDADVGGGVRSGGDSDHGDGHLAVTFLARTGYLTFGAVGQIGGELFVAGHDYAGVLAGSTIGRNGPLRLDVVGEFGAHFVPLSSGLDLGGTTSTISAGDTLLTVPYAGLRAGPTLVLGHRTRSRMLLGLWLGEKWDLAGSTAHYTIATCSDALFSNSCSYDQRTYHVGGTTFDLGLRIGGEFAGP